MFCRILHDGNYQTYTTASLWENTWIKSVNHVFHIPAVFYSLHSNFYCFSPTVTTSLSRCCDIHCTVNTKFTWLYKCVSGRERERHRGREIADRVKGRERLCCYCFLTPFLRNPALRMNSASLSRTGDSWNDFSGIISSSKETLQVSTQHLKCICTKNTAIYSISKYFWV